MLAHLRVLVRGVVLVVDDSGTFRKWPRLFTGRSNYSVTGIAAKRASRNVVHFPDFLRLYVNMRVVRHLERGTNRVGEINANRLRVFVRFLVRGNELRGHLTVVGDAVRFRDNGVLSWNDRLLFLCFASFPFKVGRVSVGAIRSRRTVNGHAANVAKDDRGCVRLLFALFASGMARRAYRRTTACVFGNGHEAIRRFR